MIESNVDNRESLKKALQMAKVVINCTGPNSVLSAPIVEASIESGTHYLDISAEMFVSVIYLFTQTDAKGNFFFYKDSYKQKT